VTREVLLPLFDDVVIVEPVEKFLREGMRAASAGEWRDLPSLRRSNGQTKSKADEMEREREKEMVRRIEESRKGRGKRVCFIRGGLQDLDPRSPASGGERIGVVGEAREGDQKLGDGEVVYDA